MASKDLAEREGSAELATRAAAERHDGLVRQFADMATALPPADPNAGDRIIEQLLAAEHPDDLNRPWRTSGSEDLYNRTIIIERAEVMPSGYDGGLGVFLVVRYTDEQTGEQSVFTTSSVAVVAQLVKAWQLGAFPLRAQLKVAERASARGFYPEHLLVLQGRG